VKGKFHHLVKNSRKRRYAKIEKDQKEQEFEDLKIANEEQQNAIQELKDKVLKFEDVSLRYEENSEKLGKLFELGIIDADGNPIMKENEE
jgi:ABC-type transport system involved in cytochrome bd biosynthesis fused ATPase/permease subunit